MESDEKEYTIDTTPFRVKVFEPEPGPSGDRLRKYNALKLNIDTYKTMWGSEYDDGAVQVENLSPGSGKKVWAVCIQCGKGRWVSYQQYRHLCGSCSTSSEETRKKMSDNHADVSGKNNPMFGRNGENNPMFGIGKNHPMYGKHHTEETCKKMSDAHSGEKHHMFGKHRSEESCIKISCTQQGIPPEKFTGFVTEEHIRFRNSGDYAKWRTAVFERDNYTCQECGAHGGVDLEAHHITSLHIHREPEYSLNTDNGITLCKLCHDKTKGREDEFYNKYTAIVKAKCGFKGDFLSISVILEGLKKQNKPCQTTLFD